MKLTGKRLILALGIMVLLGLIAPALRPRPVQVDLAPVTRAPLELTVNEDGRTRIRDRYVVSAPLAGQMQRIALKPGDPVQAGQTLLTAIEPGAVELLNPRQHAQAQARVKALEAAQRQAETVLEREQTAWKFAQSELERSQKLHQAGTLAVQELEAAQQRERVARETARAAEFAVHTAVFERELAEAALEYFERDGAPPDALLSIASPVTGTILRVWQESATVVAPGTPLVEVGDPANLEVEIDVLSMDAVRIRPGARVVFEYWGGAEPLEGRVRLVEPAAFTKISALGVEEQRVWVIADFTSPPEEWAGLGDGYRVEARIVVWEADDVLKVPAGALFRHLEDWAVFVRANGRAELRPVRIGVRGRREVQILSGLEVNEQVVVHPSDRLGPGVRIQRMER